MPKGIPRVWYITLFASMIHESDSDSKLLEFFRYAL